MPRQKIHEDRTDYKNQYNRDNYERIAIMAPKGTKKKIYDLLRTFEPRISLNKYVNILIESDIELHGGDEDEAN